MAVQAAAVICGGKELAVWTARLGVSPRYGVFAEEFFNHAQSGFLQRLL